MEFQAKIKRIIPHNALDMHIPIPKCYCGISLSNENFKGSRLKSVIKWLASHGEQCCLVVGDDLQRWNIMIWNGVPYEEARNIAKTEGEVFLEHLKPLLESYSSKQFQVTRWQELTKQTNFECWQKKVNAMLSTETDLAESLETSAKNFLVRQINRGVQMQIPPEKALTYSMNYIIEEIAVFGQLSQEGWCVDVYPGQELPILKKIATSQYENIPKPLRERISIELKISQQFLTG